MPRQSRKSIPYDVRPFSINVPKELQKLHEAVEWYFACAESEMGIESNWSAMVSVWAKATTIDESAEQQMVDSIDRKRSQDAILRATKKYRTICKALECLSPSTLSFLQSLFYEKQYDKSLEGALGRCTHVVAQNPSLWGLPDLDGLSVRQNSRSLQKARRAIEERYVQTLKQLEAQCAS